jgi:ADP-ribose pyrophosphatase
MTITKTNEQTVYSGPRFDVKRADFERDSDIVTREWIEPGDAVAVLPYSIKDNYFTMALQPREITGRYVLSLCAGKIEPGEAPGNAAKRELSEELGLRYEGTMMEFVGVFYSSEGITTEKTYIFLAKDCVEDEDAVIDVEEGVTADWYPLRSLPTVIERCDNAKAAIALRALHIKLLEERARQAARVLHDEAGR